MSNLLKYRYMETCGVIASGKTTAVNVLKELGYIVNLEKFDINPFLQQFYDKPEDHALETEIAFLIQHYYQIKNAIKEKQPFVCDFSLLLDLVFADVTLTAKEKKVFLAVYNEVSSQVLRPDVLIYLKCNPEILLERIRKRGREIEKSITLDYLKKLDKALRKRIGEAEKNLKIMTIDSEKYDFAHNESDKSYILNFLKKEICH